MKTKTSNLTRVLVTFLVSFICIFGASSYGFSQKRAGKNKESKPIPGNYKYSCVAPSGQMLYYNTGWFTLINPETRLWIIEDELKGVAVTNPNDDVRSGNYKNAPNYLTGVVVVPETINVNGEVIPVLGIGENAFYGCDQVTEIVLPKTIRQIMPSAFKEMKGLKKIIWHSDPPEHFEEIDLDVLHVVPENSMVYYSKIRYKKTNRGKADVSIEPFPIGYDFYNSENIVESMEKLEQYLGQNRTYIETQTAWGPSAEKFDFFVSMSPDGKPLCFSFIEGKNEVAFVNPRFRGDYVTGNVIIPSTVNYNGTEYPVTAIKEDGLQCKGAYTSTYFIPSTVTYIEDGNLNDERIIVCNATNPPQINGKCPGSVVQVPKGCLKAYQEADGWGEKPALIMEVDDDFQQYLDEGRIAEYLEKIRTTVDREKMLKTAHDEAMRESQEEYQKYLQAKKEQERQAKAEEERELAPLRKKYGSQYVDAMQKGQITIGMPKGLVEYGIQNRLFKRFTSMSLDSQTATREVYDLYRFNPSDILTYKVGWISFTNGKVSSIHWY